MDRVPDVVQSARVTNDGTTTSDFQLFLRVVREQVTVSASGQEEATYDSIQAVSSLTASEISEKNTQSLGDGRDHELGVATRTFGPDPERPAVRACYGDRVLVR